jgi:PEGA domain
MEHRKFAATAGLVFILVVLVFAPAQLGRPIHSGALSSGLSVGSASGPAPSLVTPAAPSPLVTFPRTVLVETFTGVWCHYCPEESIALHYLDLSTDRSALAVAELHVCALPSNCLENYVPPDKTSDTRGAFYNVQGFPTIFFDGAHSIIGAVGSVAQTQIIYKEYIANASAIPANVSIAQTADVVSGKVAQHASINSGVTGSYNVVSYLMELIDKQNLSNGYGPHDVDRVVRSTLYNHPVSLVAGTTTDISATGAINPAWNELNLSVITLVQQNSTKIIQNANYVPVTTLTTAVATNLSTLISTTTATITVHVANSSTAAPVSGASVTLTASSGGTFSPASGVTASDGSFTSTFTAPTVSASATDVVTAQVTAAGYTTGSGTTGLVVTPKVLPLVPTALSSGPGSKQVPLNWTTPASGGSGLTYHVYRSTAQSGTYNEIGVSTTPGYVDTGLTGGLSYWYKVSAQNSYGFSPNTSAISATGVTATTQGIPSHVGWWLSIDSVNFSSRTNASLALYLPVGFFAYNFGPRSYAFTSPDPTGTVAVSAGHPLSFAASFFPRYASVQGTVSPSNAVVVLNGSTISVVGGSFMAVLAAGTYSLNVTAPGYVGNTTSITLTPGNTSSVSVLLQAAPSSTVSNGGLTGGELTIAIAGVVVVVAIIVGALAVSMRGKRHRPPRTERQGRGGAPQPPSE